MSKKGENKTEQKEQERAVEHAWIFDVDGVLTHPSEKKMTEPELLRQIRRRLEAGEPVALNTGRAIDFIIKKIIEPLERSIGNKKILNNFFATGEKGAVSIVYDESGKRAELVDESISIPLFLQEAVRKLVREKFAATMFFDETKRTMISVEMRNGLDVKEFGEQQKILNQELSDLLVKYKLEKDYKIDPSRIATDVENKYVGKALGVQRTLWWLSKMKIKPKQFIAFGDSPADVVMAEELYKRKLPFEFVFVGEKELLQGKNLPFPVVQTVNCCEKGVVEYFQSLKWAF